MKKVSIWTDGACKGNPGVGGWGVVLKCGRHVKEIYGGVKHSTSPRMELKAVIEAFKVLTERCDIQVYTDSTYVQKGMEGWLKAWKSRGWKTNRGNDVKNVDLWKELDELSSKHKVKWNWVKGHSGDKGNDRADELANLGVAQVRA